MTIVPASGPRDAKLACVGMAPASYEVQLGKPFVGPSGRYLNDALLHHGMSRDDVFVTNILDRPTIYETIFKEPKHVVDAGLARLAQEMETVRPNAILLCGNDPLQVFTGHRSITKWRGSILEASLIARGTKVIPAQHPAVFVRGQWKWLPIFKYIDVARAVEESRSRELHLPERRPIIGPSLHQVDDYFDYLLTKDPICLDYETTGDYSEISCIGLGASADEAICIPLDRAHGHQHYWTSSEECHIWQRFAHVVQTRSIIAQNAGFEWIHSWKNGVYPYRLWLDIMTAHHCMYPDFTASETIWGKKRDPDTPGHGLAFINSQYTRTPYYKDDGRRREGGYTDENFWAYNCTDVMVEYDIAQQMCAELKSKGLWELYQAGWVEPFYPATRMEWDGVLIDIETREKAKVEYLARAKELQQTINNTLGYVLNVNSPKQMHRLLYEEKGYQPKLNPKTKRVTADKHAVAFFAQKHGDSVLEMIAEKRRIDDLIGDVLDQELDSSNHIHTHYKIGGTSGTRWSSSQSILGSGTNLQNLPRKGIARRLFLPG